MPMGGLRVYLKRAGSPRLKMAVAILLRSRNSDTSDEVELLVYTAIRKR